MKLSLAEAILLGSTIRPQAFGQMFDSVGSCAFGAAHEAVGGKFQPNDFDINLVKPLENWPWIASCDAACPDCGSMRDAMGIISIHLNDRHRWSRERIAEWISTIEPQEESSTPELCKENLIEANK